MEQPEESSRLHVCSKGRGRPLLSANLSLEFLPKESRSLYEYETSHISIRHPDRFDARAWGARSRNRPTAGQGGCPLCLDQQSRFQKEQGGRHGYREDAQSAPTCGWHDPANWNEVGWEADSGAAEVERHRDGRDCLHPGGKKGSAAMPVHGLIAAVAPMPDLASGGTAANDLPMRGTAAQNAAQTGMAVGGGSGNESIPAGSTIKGVILNPTPAADGSSVLQSQDKDLKLESGTRLEIGLTAAQ